MRLLWSIACGWLLISETAAIEFSAPIYRVSERGGKAILIVTRAGGAGAASVEYTMQSNSASADVDFVSASGALAWQAGDSTSKVLEVQIFQDAFEEEPQDFFITLSNATGDALGARSAAQVIIEDPGVRFEELYGSTFPATGALNLIASVTAITATRVEFLEGNTLLGSSSAPRPDGNFAIAWNNIPRGNYTIRARAFDATGASFTSPSRTLLFSGPTPEGANLTPVHVDQNNKTGVENGSVERPFTTIQKGIDNVARGGIVKVALGTYRESILIDRGPVQVLGGFQGDFTTRNGGHTKIEPTQGRAGFGLHNAGDTRIEGFAISGAARAFLIVGDTLQQSFPKLRDNIITRNGEAFRAHGGGGIHAETSNLELIGNEISFNKGGRGAGVSAGGNQASIVIRDNLVRGNIASDDHGGGLYIMANGVIAGNRIEDNEVGRAVDYGGWGGGLILFGNSNDFFPQIALSNNIVTGNYAGSGSGEFFDEGARATVDHELIYKNKSTPGGGGAILVDGCCNTTVLISHSTVADNEGHRPAGNGVLADTQSATEIRNSIFWNNGGPDFVAIPDSTLKISYTLSGDTIATGDGITAGPGNIRADPLFANAFNHDYRLKSTRGRWSPAAFGWIQDAVNSPAIDAADPAADFSWETLPNGGRADLGFYGNRAEANLSATVAQNRMRIVVKGANGRPYHLERSDDLAAWSELTTLTSVTGQLEYSDEIAANPGFYRLRQ